MEVKVRVPATSANLGPGFDSFGVALTLYNQITLTESEQGLSFSGCPEAYANRDNLIYQAYEAAMKAMELPVKGLHIHIDAQIPISRGLGSSAALLTAGVLGANALHGSPLSRQDLLELTNPIEGHPDNLAPAIFGGLTASMTHQGRPVTVPCALHPQWQFLALVPDFPLSTAAARGVLPDSYSRADAVQNIGRSALVLKALELGDEALLAAAMEDVIHQPYRKTLIPDYPVIEALVKNRGAAFCLSGAGSTLLCITRQGSLAEQLQAELPRKTQANWSVLPLQADLQGAQIL